MCDLIPDWTGNVLEPACGNGNFLVEIARRKLAAGMDTVSAASTILGVDIQADNVEEARTRLLEILPGTEEILEHNIVVGNFLDPKGTWFLEEES